MTKDVQEKVPRNKIRRTSKFYRPADPAKKSHRDAEKKRRYNKALWFNKLQDLMDPQKSRKYKREHILTWTTNRIWALKINEKIQEISDKGELEDTLSKLEQLIKFKREAARTIENELDQLKSELNKNDNDSDCYTEDTSYMTCQYIAPNATTLPPQFGCVESLQYNPYLATLYMQQNISPVILNTSTTEQPAAVCSINNDTVSTDMRWDERSVETAQDTDGEKSIEVVEDVSYDKESIKVTEDDTIELRLKAMDEIEEDNRKEDQHVQNGNVEEHPCLQNTAELIRKIIELDDSDTTDDCN